MGIFFFIGFYIGLKLLLLLNEKEGLSSSSSKSCLTKLDVSKLPFGATFGFFCYKKLFFVYFFLDTFGRSSYESLSR